MAAQVYPASRHQHHASSFCGYASPPQYGYARSSRRARHLDLSSPGKAKANQVPLPLRVSFPPSLSSAVSYYPLDVPPVVATAAEDYLRRKTPAGTLIDAYNGAFVESDVRPHAAKHLLATDAHARRAPIPAQAGHGYKRIPSTFQTWHGLPESAASPSWQVDGLVSSGSLMSVTDSSINPAMHYHSVMDWQYSSYHPAHGIPSVQAPVGPNGLTDFPGQAPQHWAPGGSNYSTFSNVLPNQQQAPWPLSNPLAIQQVGFTASYSALKDGGTGNYQAGAQQRGMSQQIANPLFHAPTQYLSPTRQDRVLRFLQQQAPPAPVGDGAMTGPSPATAPNTFALDYETPEQVLQKGYTVYRDLLSAVQRVRSQQATLNKLPKGDQTATQSAKATSHSLFNIDRISSGRQPSLSSWALSSNSAHRHRVDSVFSRWKSEADLYQASYNVARALNKICEQGSMDWIEGMLLDGSISYVLGEHENAIRWYSRILALDSSHVEANSNLAATYLAQGHRSEAEQYWRMAVHLRPTYFEAVEQLVQLLVVDRRHKDAAEVLEHIQTVLRSPADTRAEHTSSATLPPSFQQFGSTGNRYANSAIDNGRLMALIHAKGNLLYNLHDQLGAAKAFEEVVLIAAGYKAGDVDNLIHSILSAISCLSAMSEEDASRPPGGYILLPPEKALKTAKLCFPSHGVLPGLQYIPDSHSLKNAVQLTSNSLLSLAKIFQDGMNPNSSPQLNFKSHHGIRNILALYYLSLSLLPSPSTANNVGILLASVQSCTHVKPMAPGDFFMFPGVAHGSGVALALTYYKYGLSLDQKHAHLYTNLGSLLKDLGQLPLAVQMYEKAVQCDASFDIALANLANAVKDQGKVMDAIKYYQKAVGVNPSFSEAVCGLANALNSVCDWKGRGGIKLEGGQLDRWHVTDQNLLWDSIDQPNNSRGWITRVIEVVDAQLLEGRNWGRHILTDQYIEYLAQMLAPHGPAGHQKQVAERKETLVALMKSWQGQRWEGARTVWLVERACRWMAWQWYLDRYVRHRRLPETSYARPRLPDALSVPNAPTVLPFHTFTLPVNAKQVRLISQRNGLRVSASTLRASWLPPTVFQPPPPPSPEIKVGYVSSDFNNHPLAHLMQSVFGMHDKMRIQAYCYATTASDNSVHRQQIEQEAPVFCDASGWSVETLVKRIQSDGIHILVNLNGYTRGARNEIFAARAAPIQMSFMGFAGTLGAEWCDYLLADEVAVPPETLRPGRRNIDPFDIASADNSTENESWVYAENIVYARSAFFCCDHRQSACADIAKEKSLTWEDEQQRRWRMRKELFPQVPDNAVIFGNFNQLYKIDPTTLRTWLRILTRVPNSYLWLLRFPADGQANLLETARDWASSDVANRILFTDVAAKSIHIARGCIADLFLDTPECNAHTTAADCLWSGTPLLTLPRYAWKMCSRMAAGILGGALDRKTPAGREAWNELVAPSEDEYEERAVKLAKELNYSKAKDGVGATGRLVGLRKLIWEGRWTCDLFDTQRWVRDLETAYEEAWRRWVDGVGGDIYLKDICKD